MNKFRYYQKEADDAICAELEDNSKCLVKMFCGTGKSLLMAKSNIHKTSRLSLFVFPSLALINQVYTDYLTKITNPSNILQVSSDGDGATTNTDAIALFLTNPAITGLKYICVTYQSYDTLVSVMNEHGVIADVAMYDEAHRAVGESYQNNIFHMGDDPHVHKQIFFTATPKNANGIVMYDSTQAETPDSGMCGQLVYDYSYFRGMIEGYLNPFEIRLDFSTDEGVNNIYKSIARAILTTGNNRILTFHSDVETERELSAGNFVNHQAFTTAFNEVCVAEFPDKVGYHNNIQFKLSSSENKKERTEIINGLNNPDPRTIYIISSCRTIGEGIDTKLANMCVFVDPKSSYVDIIQNIGRVLRKSEGKGCSTVLIPCWVDRSKYEEVQDDPDARDEIIRRDVQEKGGNFNGILNVVSALKQEDEDLYDACLHYPDRFSPKEIKRNLQSQGYQILDAVDEDGDLISNLEYVMDKELNRDQYEECETDEELIQQIAEENDVCVEIHTDSLEQPVENYNRECESGEVVRLFRNKPTEEEMEEEEDLSTTYQPIVKKDQEGKEPRKRTSREDGEFREPNRKNKIYMNVHNNEDVKVLWKVCGDGLLDGVSQAIEPEVIDMWEDRLAELKVFIDGYNKKPSPTAIFETEKKLGLWLSRQKQKYEKNNMNNKSRQIKWKEFCESYKIYLLSEDEKWENNLKKLKDFICLNNKRPNTNSFCKNEKFIGLWFCNQQKNYNEKIKNMKSKNKREQWEHFINDYKEYFLDKNDIWEFNFKELNHFISANNRVPLKKAKQENEKKLGLWLSAQKHNYKEKKHSMNTYERQEEWEQFMEQYKELLLTDDEIWVNTYETFIQFIENNNRYPSQKSSNSIEKKLGGWLSSQKTKYINKTMKECRIPLWETILEKYKEFLLNDDEIWVKNYKNLINFIEINNKTPNTNSINTNEKLLGLWFSRNKMQYSNNLLTGVRLQKWEEFSENYKHFLITSDEKWSNDFEFLKEFIIKNNKRPSNTSLNAEEKFIAKWLGSQITNYKQKKNSMITIERQEIWKQFMDKYGYLLSNDEKWNKEFQKAKEFIDKNKKRPNKNSTDESEKSIGIWLTSNITQFNSKIMEQYPERVKLFSEFLEVYNNYLLSGENLWNRRFEGLKEFLDCNKKTPSNKSNDKNEKLLNSWLTDQKRNYKNGKLDKEQRNKWRELRETYEELLLNFDEIWVIKFDELKKYIQINNKTPSNKSKNTLEKNIGSWFSNQKQHYKNKKGSMKTPERQALWAQFLKDYAHILNTPNDDTDDDASISSTSTTTSAPSTNSAKPKKQPAPKKKSMEYTQAPPPPPPKKELTEEEKAEKDQRRRVRTKSKLSEYHKQYKVMRSDNLHKFFQENPSEFEKYHDCAAENESSYDDQSEIPLNKIIDMLDNNRHKKTKTLLDLGCGPVAKIKLNFDADPRYKVISFDHLAITDHITACDIAHLPAEIEEDSVDFVVLSLAMWGSNCEEYVKEAHRVLETNGILYIGEPTKRWTPDATELVPTPEPAQRLVDLLERNGFRILERDIKKFSVFKCSKR